MFDQHPRARDRLASDLIIWMTTVRPDGQPQNSPVWFLLDGEEILIYSAHSSRITNVTANPHVALNLDGNGRGGDIVTIEGSARVAPDEPTAYDNLEYVEKYRAAMERNGWTPQNFAERYPVAVRVTFERGRAW